MNDHRPTINKKELVFLMHKKSRKKIPIKSCELALDCLIDIITKELKKDHVISIPNFGKFINSRRRAKIGNLMQNGKAQKILIPEHNVPAFRASFEFKATVNPSYRLNNYEILDENDLNI